jgi:hypothetical protein
MGMIDTEFGSELLSYESDDLSEDDKSRRQRAGVGKAANMAVGFEWRSVDVSIHFSNIGVKNSLFNVKYIAYLRWLSLRYQKKVTNQQDEPVAVASQPAPNPDNPPKKCRKALKKTKIVKTTFDTAPQKMNDQGFSSKKTVPFKHMVNSSWLEKHPDCAPRLLPGADWLIGFFSHLKNEDLLAEDMKYIQEVVQWRAECAVRSGQKVR